MSKSIALDSEKYRTLDSIYRFISSQNTAHSNYLLVYALATVTYIVTFLIQAQLRVILILMGVPFALLGIWLYGRLRYYMELGVVTQNFMALTSLGIQFSGKYSELVAAEQRRERGLLDIIGDSLFCRISDSLRKQFDFKGYENFKEVTRKHPIRKRKALLIACSNSIYEPRYRAVLARFNA